MKIVFFGSDDFAVTNLEQLVLSGREIAACVTPPDKARGRGMHTQASEVKQCARQHRIPVFQPEDISQKSFLEDIASLRSDLFVVIAYGKILSNELLAIPRLFSVNVHASLLPRYRGAAPVNWALIRGEQETGVSVIKMNPQLDAGDILSQARLKVEDADTAVSLRAKLARLGADLLNQTVADIQAGHVQAIPQDKSQVTFAPKLTKDLGLIHWQDSAFKIHNMVRGLQPWPSAYTFYKDKLLKILETEIVGSFGGVPGTIVEILPSGFVLQTGDKSLLVKKVHLASAKAMPAKDFILGHRLAVGMTF